MPKPIATTATPNLQRNMVLDYLFTSSLDTNGNLQISHVSSRYNLNNTTATTTLPLSIQNLLHSIIPKNIYNFPSTEHCTFIPLNDVISKYTHSYLYTVSTVSHNNIHSTPKILTISIITSFPIFEAFKPLLHYLLHESIRPDFAFERMNLIFNNINNSHLNDLINHFSHLNSASRFALTRLQPDISFNDALKLPPMLSSHFTDSGNLFKTSINLGLPNLNFPVQIPKSSLVSSQLVMFGLDFQRSSVIKELLSLLQSTTIGFNQSIFQETCLTPYSNIQPLHVLINALILRKKVVFYARNICYNTLMGFIQALYLIHHSACCGNSSPNADLKFYPIIDKSTVQLLFNKKSFLIGTSDPELLNNLDYNVFLNLDTHSLHVNMEEGDNNNDDDALIEEKFFGLNSSRSSLADEVSLEHALKNLEPFVPSYANQRISIRSEFTSQSMTMSASGYSNISSIDSFHADTRLPMWESTCFPKILNKDNNNTIGNNNHHKTAHFLNSFQPTKYPKLLNTSAIPRTDKALDVHLDHLVRRHHDDETLFVLITNYLRNLTTRILPAFYHFTTFLQIRDFRAYVLLELNKSNQVQNNDVEKLIRDFISAQDIIQPFPLNFPFESNQPFLDDSKLFAHYARIVLGNVPLLKTAVHFNATAFHPDHLSSTPGFLFTWNDEDEGDNEVDYNGDDQRVSDLKVRLDSHYLIGILDRMIDGTCNDSWQLNKYLLLQIFKALNSIFKSNGFNDVLVDLFIEKRGDESFVKSCNLDISSSSIPGSPTSVSMQFQSSKNSTNSLHSTMNDASFFNKMRRLGVSPNNMEFVKEAISNSKDSSIDQLTKLKSRMNEEESPTNKSTHGSKSSKNKTHISTEHCEEDEILTHIGSLGMKRFTKLILVAALYLSIKGPEDIIETRKGIRRKDLLMTEFKKFLSGVLNDHFFKDFILMEMDDFVKLTVNDFIDFHM